MDKRDSQTWVALELTHLGEQRAEEGTLAKSLRKDLSVDTEWSVFIPSVTFVQDSKKTTIHLMEGYAFVATGLPETSYFALERKGNVAQVLSVRGSKGMRALSVIQDSKIKEIRAKMKSLQAEILPVGSRVVIVDGIYANLSGDLVAADGEVFFVHIALRSLNVIATIKHNLVEIEGKHE